METVKKHVPLQVWYQGMDVFVVAAVNEQGDFVKA
jgi:hypothetical protein